VNTPISILPPPVHERRVWATLAVVYAIVCAALGLRVAFQSELVAPPDTRHHVFWMQRYVEPGAFPGDVIADYYQAMAPSAYAALYRAGTLLGAEPLWIAKVLPAGLGVLCALLAFRLGLALVPSAPGAFLVSVLTTQMLWMQNDLPSGTPRAFVYPFVLAFLLCWIRGRWVAGLAAALGLGFFYPGTLFIVAGAVLLGVVRWRGGWPLPSRQAADYLRGAAMIGVLAVALTPFVLSTHAFGPVIHGAEARLLPEFWKGGRIPFFTDDPVRFWLTSNRSGFLPTPLDSIPWLLWAGLALPVWLALPERLRPALLGRLTPEARSLLARLFGSSCVLFGAAHVLLFSLHQPNRYVRFTFRMLLALAAGVVLVALFDALVRRLRTAFPGARGLGPVTFASVAAMVCAAPLIQGGLPKGNNFEVSAEIGMHRFFRAQPVDTVVAGICDEADNVPVFAGRSTVAGRKFATPYHRGYHRAFRERADALIEAHFTPDPAVLMAFLMKYRVRYWLVRQGDLEPGVFQSNRWLRDRDMQESVGPSRTRVSEGQRPVLAGAPPDAVVFRSAQFQVIDCNRLFP